MANYQREIFEQLNNPSPTASEGCLSMGYNGILDDRSIPESLPIFLTPLPVLMKAPAQTVVDCSSFYPLVI